jgi:cobalt/nickel transport system permease protein
MDIATVDFWATSGRSYLHRASPVAKIAAAAAGIAAVVIVQNLLVLASIYLFCLAAARRSGIPLRPFAAATAYPAVFALLLAVAQFDGGWVVPMTTIAKAMSAASVVVLLISTTPYPQLFAPLRHVLPAIVVDVLYVTYRSVFIVLGILGQVLAAMRLRGGFLGRNIGARTRNFAAAFGLGAIHAVDVSERTYTVMRVRGYAGGLSGERSHGLRTGDAPLLVAAAMIAAASVVFRYEWRFLNPYSWMLPLLATAVLLLCLVVPRRGRAGGAS